MNKEAEVIEAYQALVHRVNTDGFFTKQNLTDRFDCYKCNHCKHVTKIVYREPGVTPFMHRCEKCEEQAESTFGQDIVPDQEPTLTWFRPKQETVIEMWKKGMESLVQHILNGGLITQTIIDGWESTGIALVQDKERPESTGVLHKRFMIVINDFDANQAISALKQLGYREHHDFGPEPNEYPYVIGSPEPMVFMNYAESDLYQEIFPDETEMTIKELKSEIKANSNPK